MKMDKDILNGIIEDYERMLGIITHRLNQLKTLRGGKKVSAVSSIGNSIRDEIEAKRKEFMKESDRIRAEAIDSAEKSKSQALNSAAGSKFAPNDMTNFGITTMTDINSLFKKDD
jgi:hypothetical protein